MLEKRLTLTLAKLINHENETRIIYENQATTLHIAAMDSVIL